ncbi:hypothetical protein E2C01_048091 [Portunus trituberculatus]|uniref:Uncharacterized protein n=1 Tax=Portunus trituberculatus TaxID=210409 RepID=A0A5B7GA89_PORTR|nr:hypothetical protein [Portunus trituberculatus]
MWREGSGQVSSRCVLFMGWGIIAWKLRITSRHQSYYPNYIVEETHGKGEERGRRCYKGIMFRKVGKRIRNNSCISLLVIF